MFGADARWCTINALENQKCNDLINAINQRVLLNVTYPPNYVGKPYGSLPLLSCVPGQDQFDCMNKIFTDQADLMQLETGLSYTAGSYYNMMPLAAEQYIASA